MFGFLPVFRLLSRCFGIRGTGGFGGFGGWNTLPPLFSGPIHRICDSMESRSGGDVSEDVFAGFLLYSAHYHDIIVWQGIPDGDTFRPRRFLPDFRARKG